MTSFAVEGGGHAGLLSFRSDWINLPQTASSSDPTITWSSYAHSWTVAVHLQPEEAEAVPAQLCSPALVVHS